MFEKLRPQEYRVAGEGRNHGDRFVLVERVEPDALEPRQNDRFPRGREGRADVQYDGGILRVSLSAGHLVDSSRFYGRATLVDFVSRNVRKSPLR